MSNNTNETIDALLAIIQKSAESGTFSLDAIQRISDLRLSANALSEENVDLRHTVTELRAEVSAQTAKLNALQAREDDVARREKAVAALELKNAVDAKILELTHASKAEFKELLHLALRSPVLRTSYQGMVPVNTQYGVQSHATSTTVESQQV